MCILVYLNITLEKLAISFYLFHFYSFQKRIYNLCIIFFLKNYLKGRVIEIAYLLINLNGHRSQAWNFEI